MSYNEKGLKILIYAILSISNVCSLIVPYDLVRVLTQILAQITVSFGGMPIIFSGKVHHNLLIRSL